MSTTNPNTKPLTRTEARRYATWVAANVPWVYGIQLVEDWEDGTVVVRYVNGAGYDRVIRSEADFIELRDA